MSKKPKVITIVGPTSSGKTSLSIEIAQKFNGEVISADSRQVYAGLDIGTGKVTGQEMQNVPHHLLDMVEPQEIYTAQNFVRDATRAISTINKKNKTPIIAGGTFFYVDLLRGKMQAVPVAPNTNFRDSLEKYSNAELLEILQGKDSRRAETIDPHNRRRLVRALEILETLGEIPETKNIDSPYDWLIIGIDIDKETLREKFRCRLMNWLATGLLAEVTHFRETLPSQRFLELGFEYTLTAEYLDKAITKEEFIEKFVQKNWQYAKRQMTWLKRDEKVEWFKPKNRLRIEQRVKEFLQD